MEEIFHAMKNVDEKLTFKLTSENKNKLKFQNFTICWKQSKLELDIYRK